MKWILESSYPDSARLAQALKDRLAPGDELAVGHDDGYLGPDEMSLSRYFVSRQNLCRHPEKKLFYIFLPIPKYWEIQPYYQYGIVVDHLVQKALIYFTQPIDRRNVQRVEWKMEDGWVYRKDYYDKYALRYCSEFLGRDGRVESRVYYSDRNQEVLVEQPLNEVISLYQDGKIAGEFYAYQDFVEYFLGLVGQKPADGAAG